MDVIISISIYHQPPVKLSPSQNDDCSKVNAFNKSKIQKNDVFLNR
jgi:hypothetical protein